MAAILQEPLTGDSDSLVTPTPLESAACGGATHPHRVIHIAPGNAWITIDLSDLWQHRDLLFLLAWRDIKVRYKQTALGAAWAILQPFMTMVVFTVFFGKLAKVPSDGVPYPIFAYAGLLPWTFFANAVNTSSNSLVGNVALISKVYFPRMIIPASAVVAGMVDFIIGSSILFGMMAFYGVWPGLHLLMLPPMVALVAMIALGVGIWLSALNVKYRDVRHAVPFMVQILLFVTPIIYPVGIVPLKWRWLLAFNPLTGAIGGFRSALLGKPFEWQSLGVSAVFATVMLTCSALWFGRVDNEFADII